MAGLIGVLGGRNPRALAERAAVPLLRRPWQTLELSEPAPDVALAFAGERGVVETDEATGTTIAFDGELFLDSGVQGGREAARTLLTLYLEQGENVDPPQGFFSAALWEARTQSLVLITDRYARRPLWTARIAGALVVASELKALIAAGLEPELELKAWAEFLAYESALGEHPYLPSARACALRAPRTASAACSSRRRCGRQRASKRAIGSRFGTTRPRPRPSRAKEETGFCRRREVRRRAARRRSSPQRGPPPSGGPHSFRHGF